MEKSDITLFDNKRECCACGACVNICPKKAISMQLDSNGFLYPEIDKELCVGCGACKRVCAYQNKVEEKGAKKVYAASRKEKDKIMKSTSGGIFAVLAEQIIEEKGVVYGASMVYEDEKLVVKHVAVDNKEDLLNLQGSKYVQSRIGYIYQDIKTNLVAGKKVLFSGTPCQVAGLNGFLGKNYDNLITVDIVCHGVPNLKLFQEYIDFTEEKQKDGRIIKYIFRDKENSWAHRAKAIFLNNDGETTEKIYGISETSYYSLFMDSEINRENCYYCKYTNANRPADITIGDFWGIQRVHPEYLSENGGKLELKCGISAVIVNSLKGEKQLEKVMDKLNIYASEFEEAAVGNPQLQRPCQYPKSRDKIFAIYQKQGYKGVQRFYLRKERKKKIKFIVKNMVKTVLPKKIICKIKQKKSS